VKRTVRSTTPSFLILVKNYGANRQRAFRQRKERHLQDLTAKVQELEKACNSIKEERDQLRVKLNNFLSNRSSEQGLLSSPLDTFRLDQRPVKNTYESEGSITPPSHSMDAGFESFNHAHLEG
jgi:predicted RNase H-like nuclease (RuvC/YqgF family)